MDSQEIVVMLEFRMRSGLPRAFSSHTDFQLKFE